MARACIYCGTQGGLTGEHVWPAWLSRTLPAYDFTANHTRRRWDPTTGEPIEEQIDMGHAPGEIRVRFVCGTCNHGWMSELEVRVRPVLEELWFSAQRPLLLSIPAMRTLSAWAYKLATVVEVMDADVAVSTPEQRRWLRDHGAPPERTQVWLARYDGNEWKLRWHRYAFGVYPVRDNAGPPTKAPPNACTTTFVAGSVALLVFLRTTEHLPPFEFGERYAELVEIWPQPKGPNMVSSATFNDAEMGILAAEIGTSIGLALGPSVNADRPLRPRRPR